MVLPVRFRAPVVLCYLEGKAALEAARELGCARGTILSRLARARRRLRARLARRGFGLPAGLAPVPALVPPGLAGATIRAAFAFTRPQAATTGVASLKAAALAEGVCRIMFLNKIKAISAVVLALAALGGGAGLLGHGALGGRAASAPLALVEPEASAGAHSDEPPPVRSDNATGWHWIIRPQAKDSSRWSHAGVVCLLDAPKKDAAFMMYIAFTFSGKYDPKHPTYRPVVFDAQGKRYLPEADRGGSSSSMGKNVALICYRLDPKVLPEEKVTFVGIEALSP